LSGSLPFCPYSEALAFSVFVFAFLTAQKMQSGASSTNKDIIDFTTDPRWFSTHPGEWETLKANEKYKIYTHSPHPILNTVSGKILKDAKRGNGGICTNFGNGFDSLPFFLSFS
jgi:hypothetical protein